ncbi:MAG: hypothetical protein IJX94_03820 [Clostridia bacterium]|nr:hypothetical protein [Clostridia bacterium]
MEQITPPNTNPQTTTGSVSDKKLTRFAYSRVLVLVLTALLCAGLVISVANDMYAFVKPQRTVTLTVDEPTSLSDLADRLQAEGILQNPWVFQLYTASKSKTDRLERFVGTLELNSAMSYRELLLAFSEGMR